MPNGTLIKYNAACRAVDKDATEIGALYQKGKGTMVDSVRYFIQAGHGLLKKKKSLPHGEWLPWLEANADTLGFDTPRTAQMLMNTAAKDEAGFVFDESEAAAISRQLWGSRSALYSSESVEWYTPAHYLQAVREVLGRIDLDPASNAQANKTIGADKIFTEKDDGLTREWFGCVFVNPPYGTTDDNDSMAAMFCNKAIEEYTGGRVKTAIILVNSLHSQSWQAPLYDYPICFVDHRIKFVAGDGTENKNPTMQNMFVYLGPNTAKFEEVFSQFGYVMHPTDRRDDDD